MPVLIAVKYSTILPQDVNFAVCFQFYFLLLLYVSLPIAEGNPHKTPGNSFGDHDVKC